MLAARVLARCKWMENLELADTCSLAHSLYPHSSLLRYNTTLSFYKKVLSDLLISRNDSFFNYCFEQIFSRKLQASINGNPVTYDQLRLHFLSLRRAYYDAHHHHSSYHSNHSSSSSISTLPHAASAFAPDGSVLKFGPFLANSTNGGREGYLAAHTILANLINNSKWDASPLLSAAQLSSPPHSYNHDNEGQHDKKKTSTSSPDASLDASSNSLDASSSSSDEPEHDKQVETNSPRKRRFKNHHSASSSSSTSSTSTTNSSRIRYNALVVTDTMEIQWMEGKDGECRKITKFERTIKRPSYASSSSNSGSSSSLNSSSSSSSSSSISSAVKNVKQRRC